MLDWQVSSLLLGCSANYASIADDLFVILFTHHKLLRSEDFFHHPQVKLTISTVDNYKITDQQPSYVTGVSAKPALELELHLQRQ